MKIKENLTIPKLIEEAQYFCIEQSKIQHIEVNGVKKSR